MDIVVDHWMLIGVVRLLVYHPQTASLLPVLIDAVDAGDYRSLATQAFLISEGIEGLSVGLNNVIVCTEDVPFQGEVDLRRPGGHLHGHGVHRDHDRHLPAIGPGAILDDDLHEPLVSDKPVLLLSGEFDPITPAALCPPGGRWAFQRGGGRRSRPGTRDVGRRLRTTTDGRVPRCRRGE